MNTRPVPVGRRYIGLDVHRDKIYVTVLDPWAGQIEQFEVSTREKDFEAFLKTLRPTDEVALEATRGARYYVTRLLTRVAAVAVANPKKIQRIAGEDAKNDRNDSFSLAFHLGAGSLPTVWIPDRETQQDRDILRYRSNLVAEQTRTKNRTGALLAEHGLSYTGADLQSQSARRFLAKVCSRLPGAAQEILSCYLEQLEHLKEQLTRVNAIVQVRATRRPEVDLMLTIRGIDVLLAFTIVTAIGCVERFATAGSLAKYAGLVPRQHASAGHNHHGRITKAGSKSLRWAVTEAVKDLCKQNGPYRNLMRRLERRKNKGVAMAACARKLLVAIWHMLTRQEPFRLAESPLVERKVSRRERRLVAARERLARDEKGRHQAMMTRQLALLQELAQHGAQIPLPAPLRSTFCQKIRAADLCPDRATA